MKRALLIGIVALCTSWSISPQAPAGAAQNQDTPYRLGSLEAKVESLSASLTEIKTAQRATEEKLNTVLVTLEGANTKLTWITGGLIFLLGLVATNLVNSWMKSRSSGIGRLTGGAVDPWFSDYFTTARDFDRMETKDLQRRMSLIRAVLKRRSQPEGPEASPQSPGTR